MLDDFSSMNWNDLSAFLAVAREKSLRGAARTLGINHSTVTRRLIALEEALGVKLFERQPDGYVLSQAGEDLLSSVEHIEDEIFVIHRKIVGRDADPRGVVRVSVPPAMLRSFLAQELVRFAEQYPRIELDIEASHSFRDLARRQADISIRMAAEVTGDIVGRRLVRYHKAIYASPDYLSRVDPETGFDPLKHFWIGWGEDIPNPSWPRGTPFTELPVRHLLFSNALHVEATREGLGISLLPCFLGDPEPGLVRVPGTDTVADKSIWILFHDDLRKTARIRAFVDFMAAAIKKHQPLLQGRGEQVC
jgi:DNA-binding transcriptional LysR family regulator